MFTKGGLSTISSCARRGHCFLPRFERLSVDNYMYNYIENLPRHHSRYNNKLIAARTNLLSADTALLTAAQRGDRFALLSDMLVRIQYLSLSKISFFCVEEMKLLRQMLNKSYANLLFTWAMGGTFCNQWWNDDERMSTRVTRQDNKKGRNGNIDWFLVRQREDRLLLFFFFSSMLVTHHGQWHVRDAVIGNSRRGFDLSSTANRVDVSNKRHFIWGLLKTDRRQRCYQNFILSRCVCECVYMCGCPTSAENIKQLQSFKIIPRY